MKSVRWHAPAGRWTALRFERLEDRRMLAQYAFGINLYDDAGGVPGALITDDTVEAGHTFFVEITAEDLRADPQGLQSMGIHVGWDPRVLEEADASFEPADPGSPLVTPDFPLFRNGRLDQDDGVIYDLRGGSSLLADAGTPIGAQGSERFVLLRFRAIERAESSLLAVQASGSVGFIPTRPYCREDLRFERQTITVIEAQEGEPNTSQEVDDTDSARLAADPGQDANDVAGKLIGDDSVEVAERPTPAVTAQDVSNAHDAVTMTEDRESRQAEVAAESGAGGATTPVAVGLNNAEPVLGSTLPEKEGEENVKIQDTGALPPTALVEACIANQRRATNGSPDPRALTVEFPRISYTGINKPPSIVPDVAIHVPVAADPSGDRPVHLPAGQGNDPSVNVDRDRRVDTGTLPVVCRGLSEPGPDPLPAVVATESSDADPGAAQTAERSWSRSSVPETGEARSAGTDDLAAAADVVLTELAPGDREFSPYGDGSVWLDALAVGWFECDGDDEDAEDLSSFHAFALSELPV